ncbi:MAG: hypothetical protein KJ646_01940 [Nanoarchaeota archaeon]|nr:hypothetical protein [Nanoarchaeota archaeon]MBU4116845.1 hypothetical protein [Nanoarchaeota archaeon]
MKNKRADIPVIIFVIGVFTVCSIALLSFYSSSISIKQYSLIGTGLIEKMNSQIETNSLTSRYSEQEKTSFSFGLNPLKWWEKRVLFSVEFSID